VETVAVCSGSGSGLMARFLGSDAQVFVTGDLRYHDALDALDADRGLVDIGHFASEVIGVKMLVRRLREAAAAAGLDLSVEPCVGEPDPFDAL
jgi:putative NIF3 family GTP cyclohydrolase 1 type 2